MIRSAIALIRVSTDAQAADDRAGLSSQRRECQRIAEREGLEIVDWLELAGVSGAKVLDDPRFRALLLRLEAPEVAGVIVTAGDRLMRPESLDDYAILGTFQRTGKVLYTANGPRDLSKDRLLTVIESELSHLERARIRERTMRAKAEHRRLGRHVAGYRGLPYGVRYDREALAWSYSPAEAEVVREAFARVLAGERDFSALARSLGIGRGALRRMLCQPLYAGFRRLDAAGRVAAEGEEQVIFGAPLIPREQWEAARAIAAARQPVPRGHGPGLYRGFVRCAHCSGPMHVHRERHGSTYRCRAPRSVQIVHRAVDEAADRAIGERLARVEVLEAALAGAREPMHQSQIATDVEAEAKRLREERERVLLAFERGLRPAEDAARRTRQIDAHLERLARAATPERMAPDPHELALELAAPFAEWLYLTTGQKRRILVTCVEWVRIARTGRAQAAVEAIRLRLPTDPNPATPRGQRRATWAAWGGSLEVPLQ